MASDDSALGTDASQAEPVPGTDSGPQVGWTRLAYLGCNCEDDTAKELCVDHERVSFRDACRLTCEGHGEMVGDRWM